MRFRSIQALRGVAAILVLCGHYAEHIKGAAALGQAQPLAIMSWGNLHVFWAVGVPLFFVISGFVMGLQPPSSGVSGAAGFALRRLLRVAPLYWIVTLVAFVTVSPESVDFLVRSLTFTTFTYPVVGPGWSLEYEMLFYLCFALVVASGVFAAAGVAVLVSLFVALAAMNLAGLPVAAAFNPLVLQFCAGLAIARVYRYEEVNAVWPLYLAIGLGVLFLSAAPIMLPFATIQILWAIGSFFLVLGLACAETRGFVVGRSRIAALLGDASYAIYLVHVPLAALTFRYVLWQAAFMRTVLPPELALALLTAYGIAAGVVVHVLVERPLLRAAARVRPFGRISRNTA